MRTNALLKALLVLGIVGSSTHAFAGYYWWKYSTNGFMDPSKIPAGTASAPDTQYQIHFNYAYRPVTNTSHADTLVVFLPGNSARTDGMTDFYEHAVNHGYYVVALDYINEVGTSTACTSNPACAGQLAKQTVDGTNYSFFTKYFGSGKPTAGQQAYNSVENRFAMFLRWLQNTADPGAGWGKFCVTANPCSGPDWSKIIIVGHSLGATNAWWILKNRGAKKGIALSGPSPRMNSSQVTPDACDITPYCLLNPNPSDTAYDMFDNAANYIGKFRVFLNFFDERYKPGVTYALPASNGTFQPGNGRNQPGNLVDMGMTETRISPTSICSSASWGTWITAMTNPDTGSAHSSTAANGADWGTTAPGFRECVWTHLLDH